MNTAAWIGKRRKEGLAAQLPAESAILLPRMDDVFLF